MFKGSLVALITPFRDHELDEGAFQEHVAWQVGQGTHGLVPCGTTGESPALADDEHKRLIALCVEVAKGKVPVIAGTGTNSTEHTIELTRQAKAAGADAALIVCPYYNKPTQEGLYQHFKAVHDAVDLPIVIYNIPGRSSVDMTNATMARLAKLPEHRRGQGCDQRPRPAVAHAGRDRRRFLPAFGRGRDRGRLSCARRRRLHLGDRQCRAAALLGDARGLAARRSRDGARNQSAPDPAARCAVRRNQPGPGQICRLAARPLHRRSAPAALGDHARDAGEGAAGDAGRRPPQLMRAADRYVAQNRRARHDYLIEDTLEAGVVLHGTEVKVLRQGQASIAEAYADESGGELFLVNANIPEYAASAHFNHQPRRPRKLLLHRKQMNRLLGAIRREGITVVPLSIYFNERGRAKVELGLARGKRKADKRQAEKQRDWQRSRARILRDRNA